MSQQKKKIESPDAPSAIGPYSQAIQMGNHLFCSGQIAFDPKSGQMVEADIRKQTRQVLANLNQVLKKAGTSPAHILKTTVFLTNLENFVPFNEEYEAFFKANSDAPFPARSTIEVSKLPRASMVEIEAICWVD